MAELLGLFFVVILLFIGGFTGYVLEQQHLDSLERRERELRHLSVVNTGKRGPWPAGREVRLCAGSVVISSDYFKTFIAGILTLFGGNLPVYETLMQRARREALVRLKVDAAAWGATEVLNVRLETSTLSDHWDDQGIISVEVIAYGTAIR